MHKLDSFIKETQRLNPLTNRKWSSLVLLWIYLTNWVFFFFSLSFNVTCCGERLHLLRWHNRPSRHHSSRLCPQSPIRWSSLWRPFKIRWISVFQNEPGKFRKESRDGDVESESSLFRPWKTHMSWTTFRILRGKADACAHCGDVWCESGNWRRSSTGYVGHDLMCPESKCPCSFSKTNERPGGVMTMKKA